MAINKKLIHFKKFSDFNSKKLSANEENTKYTVGVGETVVIGAPDILYQSICWIKDTKQQWTHGELYDCDMGDVKPYVAFFTLDEIMQLAESGESRQCDQQDYMGILDAVESGRPILIPNGYAANGYATVVNKLVDDCIYLTVVGDVSGGAPRFYDVNVYEGEVVASEITYQNELVSGTTIKTVNGQSLLGSGDIVTYNEEVFPYNLAVELSDIVESAENGTTFEYYESDYEELRTAIDQGRTVLVENLYDGSGKAVVVNQIASDMVYLTLVANLSSDATPRFYAVEIDGRAGSAREITYQQALVSGQNIKTVNGQSLLGSGDIIISGGSGEKGEKGDKGDKGDTGVGVQSVAQTTTSNADGGSNVVTVTLTDGTKSTFTVKNGSKGSHGANGADGATFTPSVDSAGNLSWTNNKGLANPPTVNIKGPKGDAGENGVSEEYVNNAIANAITNAINASY